MYVERDLDIKAVIMVGNLNCSPEDIDVSNPAALKLEKTAVLHEEVSTIVT